MKISLFIDTSTKFLVLCLFNSKETIVFTKIQTNNNMTSLFNYQLDLFMKKNNISFFDINNLYLSNGPGSFTGVRIAIVFTKIFALLRSDLKVFVINSLELQRLDPNAISIISATNNKSFILDKKKIRIIENNKIDKLNANFYVNDYLGLNDKHIILNLRKFKEVIDVRNLEPIYSKSFL